MRLTTVIGNRCLAAAWLLVIASSVCEGRQSAVSSGGVSVTGVFKQRINEHQLGWTDTPAANEPVRLCSPDEVLETQSDGHGGFRFQNVPPGTYDLVAAGKSALTTLSGVRVGISDVGPLIVTRGEDPTRHSPCMKVSRECPATDWSIEYKKPANQISGLLYGVVQQESGILSGAFISVFRAGETRQIKGRFSDSEGRFQFLLTPGYYKLRVTHDGFQSVDVATFLVPLRNQTKIIVSTLRAGILVVCQ